MMTIKKLNIKKYVTALIFGLISVITYADNLLVFVNESQPIDKAFINNHLGEIKQLAERYQLKFMVKSIKKTAAM